MNSTAAVLVIAVTAIAVAFAVLKLVRPRSRYFAYPLLFAVAWVTALFLLDDYGFYGEEDGLRQTPVGVVAYSYALYLVIALIPAIVVGVLLHGAERAVGPAGPAALGSLILFLFATLSAAAPLDEPCQRDLGPPGGGAFETGWSWWPPGPTCVYRPGYGPNAGKRLEFERRGAMRLLLGYGSVVLAALAFVPPLMHLLGTRTRSKVGSGHQHLEAELREPT